MGLLQSRFFSPILHSINFQNNKSVEIIVNFVTSEICRLINNGSVIKVSSKLSVYIVSPLSVVENRYNKGCILGLSKLNTYVKYDKNQVWRLEAAMNYFEKKIIIAQNLTL